MTGMQPVQYRHIHNKTRFAQQTQAQENAAKAQAEQKRPEVQIIPANRPTAVKRHRHDPVFGHHVQFNGANGTKLRYTIGLHHGEVTRASAPELLDIKINDYCPFGCPACYQGSTTEGGHGKLEDIIYLADLAQQAGVFEVAMGGGEPTLHPHFLEILQAFSERGIVPNFTTRNPRFLRNNWDKLLGVMGGFAVSVDHGRDVDHLGHLLEGLPREEGQINLHVIMGLISEEDFVSVLQAAERWKMRVTLLGYKTNGRGSLFTPADHSWWLKHTLQSNVPVSIDTALALKDQQLILDAGIDQVMFHTTEGHFSAYMDAVNMTLQPSSYDDSVAQPITDAWLRDFMAFAGPLTPEQETRAAVLPGLGGKNTRP